MGAEPGYFADPDVSKLVDLCLQLAGEVHVVSQRVRVLEMALARAGVVGAGDVDAFRPDGDEQARLDDVREAMVARLARIITEAGPAEHPLRQQWEEQAARSA